MRLDWAGYGGWAFAGVDCVKCDASDEFSPVRSFRRPRFGVFAGSEFSPVRRIGVFAGSEFSPVGLKGKFFLMMPGILETT